MILFIDNYDSFTYNLVDYFGQLAPELTVVRNNKITIEEIQILQPSGIVISPGPGTPDNAGKSCAIIESFYQSIPILGVCLGHQCVGHVFGGKVIQAQQPMHGKTSQIYHNQFGIFNDLPLPFTATRYHSLIIENINLPNSLEITAKTEDGIIMGIRHKEYPVNGVQFHPESILTDTGLLIIKNWYEETLAFKKHKNVHN
jgi:anthranilate synthase/aminodeoxychorismate synthase-like glutamine amidotransferase